MQSDTTPPGCRAAAVPAPTHADGDVRAGHLEPVMDEASSRHRLDGRAHLLATASDMGNECAECVTIGSDGDHLDRPAYLVEHMDVKPLAR